MGAALKQRLMFEAHYDQEIFEELGVMFISAAYAECGLHLALNRLLHAGVALDQGYVTLTSGLEARQKTRFIRTVAAQRLTNKGSISSIGQCCDHVDSAFGKRHIFAHGIALENERPNVLILQEMKYAKDGEMTQPHKFKASHIRELAVELHRTTDELTSAIDAAGVPLLGRPISRPRQFHKSSPIIVPRSVSERKPRPG